MRKFAKCSTEVKSCLLRTYCINFYSASALLAMRSAVISLSVCPSVRHVLVLCLDVSAQDRVQAGRTIFLVSEEVKFIEILAGDQPQRGR